jgi:hypothetical protein
LRRAGESRPRQGPDRGPTDAFTTPVSWCPIKLHNTNRSLGFLAADAGWPGEAPVPKAERAAELIGATPHVEWYHEWIETHPTSPSDLVLPLANDRGVRHLIGQRGEPILLSSTTSPHGTAALHRQIPGRDDCMDCRFPDPTTPKFECSTGAVPTSEGTSTDAALPFLSATAGLLLASGLLQLQVGSIGQRDENQWTLWVATTNRSWQASRRACATGCQNAMPAMTVRNLNRNSRWRELVGACVSDEMDVPISRPSKRHPPTPFDVIWPNHDLHSPIFASDGLKRLCHSRRKLLQGLLGALSPLP